MSNEHRVEKYNEVRRAIKALAAQVWELRDAIVGTPVQGEEIANVVLSYRHLEDASMRMGKSIQAADGGVSVYDRETTVGA